ncbi:MAG: prepilin-type N-terminal cleavage/methylation domain-containing protein [Helicobacter sp.]|nr:prepilin-type N-terminal cleavage/methylation domain-containing protein [Helicobacter sp.]
MRNRNLRAFSMIELIFVIVILGIIAAIAIPKLTLSRSDAQFSAINADIQSIISSMQQKFLTEEVSGDINGQMIMTTANLSPLRWVPQNGSVVLGKNSTPDTKNNCLTISVNNSTLTLSVNVAQTPASPLCKKLHEAYPTSQTFQLERFN